MSAPKGLGDALRRAAPALRQMGVECRSEGKRGHAGVINWAIRKIEAGTMSAKSAKSATDADMRTLRTSSPVAPFDTEAF